MDNSKKIRHLYARAGFGLRFEDLRQAQHSSIKQAVDLLFQQSEENSPLDIISGNISFKTFLVKDMATRKMYVQEQRQQEHGLNITWVNQMSTSNAQLREKDDPFWHNHFACRTKNSWFAQQLNNIHRTNALGNFRSMLLEVSKSPAMLEFLNNQQNRKNHPNENFARELMELFTIGRGNYTEQDVKESARSFTGWTFNTDGLFVTKTSIHDDGQKTFLGNTGNFDGEDIINMLLAKRETAYFICNKLYKYLVNEIPDVTHVNAMTDIFYNNKYEIKPLLNYIFNADWFYDDKNTGNMIKAPVELIIGLNRQFNINYKNPDIVLQFQRTLGQLLFYPPNVAGWPGGKNWIDSSSLMYRMKIPSMVLNDGVIDFTGKADPEDEAFIALTQTRKKAANVPMQTQPDWDKFLADIPVHTSKATIAQVILSSAIDNNLLAIVNRSTDIKTMVVELVSTPEYQLC